MYQKSMFDIILLKIKHFYFCPPAMFFRIFFIELLKVLALKGFLAI